MSISKNSLRATNAYIRNALAFSARVSKAHLRTAEQFRATLALLSAAVQDGVFPPQLRMKRAKGTRDVWEMSWAADGRATFQHGEERTAGDLHIVWRRIGTHDIFRQP